MIVITPKPPPPTKPPPLGSYSWQWLALSWRLDWRCRWRRCTRTIRTALWWWLSALRAPLRSQICDCLQEVNEQREIRRQTILSLFCVRSPVARQQTGTLAIVRWRWHSSEFLRFPSSYCKAGEPSHTSVSRLTLLRGGTPTTKPGLSRVTLWKDAGIFFSLSQFVRTWKNKMRIFNLNWTQCIQDILTVFHCWAKNGMAFSQFEICCANCHGNCWLTS